VKRTWKCCQYRFQHLVGRRGRAVRNSDEGNSRSRLETRFLLLVLLIENIRSLRPFANLISSCS
jgi:hypothetical protein